MEESVDPQILLNWPVTIIKAEENELVLRDHSGAEIQVISSDSKLVFKRIW